MRPGSERRPSRFNRFFINIKIFDKIGIKFIATGGINNDNYLKFLNLKNIIAVGSSNIKSY